MSFILRQQFMRPKMFPDQIVRHIGMFEPTDQHIALKNTCREFADKELKPIAAELDSKQKFPAEQIAKLAKLGLMGMNVDSKYGGSGLDMLSSCLAIEEISAGCAGTGIIMSIHNCLYCELLQKLGTEEQKDEFLKDYTTGKIGAFALSEYDAGSDVVNIKTSAKQNKTDSSYIINGTKAWVTSGKEASAGIIFATVDSSLRHKGITAFLINFNAPGVTIGEPEDKMGIRASSTCEIKLDNVEVPAKNIIGEVGQGFKIAMQQLQVARIGVSSQALGIAQASLELALQYANIRDIYGTKLKNNQLVQSKLAKMSVGLESARLLTWKSAVLHDSKKDYRKLSSMAKFAASRCAVKNSHYCVQIGGGMGFMSRFPAERHYRDARITQIYGGVDEVQQMVIANQLHKDYGYE